MTALITLNADGALLIQTMREPLASAQEAWMPDQSAAVYNKFEKNLGQLVDLLIPVDLFVVKLRPLFDTQLTLFELQFLCVISERHKGKEEPLQNILNRCLPQDYKTEANYILRLIIGILEESGLKLQFPKLLKDNFLWRLFTLEAASPFSSYRLPSQ